MANIFIKSAKLIPNICVVGSQFIIQVEVLNKKKVLGDDMHRLVNANGSFILVPNKTSID